MFYKRVPAIRGAKKIAKSKKLIEYKEILFFFMSKINKEFNDVLWLDAVELICDK